MQLKHVFKQFKKIPVSSLALKSEIKSNYLNRSIATIAAAVCAVGYFAHPTQGASGRGLYHSEPSFPSILPLADEPFNHYPLGEVRKLDGKYYLRNGLDVLWIMSEEPPFAGKAKLYRPNTKLGIIEYDLGKDQIEEFQSLIQLQKEGAEKLKKMKAPLQGCQPVHFKRQEAMPVFQHEYAVTDATSERPVLASHSAVFCLILALYDSKNKIAVLAHIDSCTNINSLEQLFSGLSLEHTVAHLCGGSEGSQYMCMQVVELLEACHIKIVNADIVTPTNNSLAIDSRTGAIYSSIESLHLDSQREHDIHKSALLTLRGAILGQTPLRKVTPTNLESENNLGLTHTRYATNSSASGKGAEPCRLFTPPRLSSFWKVTDSSNELESNPDLGSPTPRT